MVNLKRGVSRVGRLIGAVLGTLLLTNALAQAPLPVGASQRAPERFGDVQTSHWAYPAVDTLSRLGVLTGYPNGTYRGEQSATRYEVAVVAARLIDYTDQILGAVPGARFEERMRRDEVTLGRTTLLERVDNLEAALSNAASLGYVERLERRVVALEGDLNAQGGTERFPARMEDGSQGQRSAQSDDVQRAVQERAGSGEAASDAPSTGSDAGSDAGSNMEPGTLRLSQRPLYPFYLGIAPGVISTAGDVNLGVQAGYDNLIGPVGVAGRLTFNGGANELRFSVDTLLRLDALINELDLYGGLGVGYTLRPSGDAFLLEAPFGAEYFVTQRVSLFGQLITSYGFAPVNSVDAAFTAGINLRF